MGDDLTKKVDSLVSQMDVFSKQIEQYLHENINEGEIVDTDDEDADIQYFKLSLNDLMETAGYSMLRDYQKYGIKWLMTLHTSGLNGIIADEMGLGKTLQVIKFLTAIKNQNGIVGPHIMIGPLSVLSNWYHEIEKFAPGEFDIHVHYGNKKERDEHLKEACREWRSNKSKKVKKSTKIKIIITTFQIALLDHQAFKNISKWYGKSMEYLILDEAHRIKNESCVLYKQLKDFPISHRLLLTGTPLQNNLQELWALLKFLVPQLFPKHEDIHDWFNNMFQVDDSTITTSEANVEQVPFPVITDCSATSQKSISRSNSKLFGSKSSRSIHSAKSNSDLLQSKDKEKIVHSLHRVLKPFILRRVKADVAIDIPHKIIKVIKCPLSALQRETLNTLRSFVEETIKNQQKQSLLVEKNGNSLPRQLSALLKDSVHDDNADSFSYQSLCKTFMTARKLCNHPFLVLEEVGSFSDEIFFKNVIEASGKMMVLDQILHFLLPRGSKILIFSQFTTTLDILGSYLSSIECGYYRIDGSTSQATRQEYIDSFNHAKSAEAVQVFLLTTPSGGVGINLQAADTVILFDQDWNPQQDLQAISRAHRLGQKNPVLVLRLISVGIDEETSSIEEMMFDKAMKKLQANKTILKNGVFATASRKLLKSVGSSNMSSRPSLSHILDEDDISSLAISSTGANEASAENEDAFDEDDELMAMLNSATGEDATTIDHEEAMKKLREEDFAFQWQTLFMQRTNPSKDSSQRNQNAMSTIGADQSPVKSLTYGYRISNVHVTDGSVESPCCRASFIMRLPMVYNHSDEISAEVMDNGWSFICDRSPEISLPNNNNTVVKIPLLDDDFVEISVAFSRRHGGDQHLLATFATQLAQYHRYLLPQLSLLSSLRTQAASPTGKHRLPRSASSRAEQKLQQNEYITVLDQELDDLDARNNTTRKRKNKMNDEDYYVTYDVSDNDDPDEDFSGKSRKKRRMKAVHSKDRKRNHQKLGKAASNKSRNKMYSATDENDIDDDDKSDICVLCNEAALDESDYWALLATNDYGKYTKEQQQLLPRNESFDQKVGTVKYSDELEVSRPIIDRERLQTLLLCDGCDGAYHLVCVGLEQVPEEDWFCALCRSAEMLPTLENQLHRPPNENYGVESAEEEGREEEEIEEYEESENEEEDGDSYYPEDNDDSYEEDDGDGEEEDDEASDDDY